MTKAIEFFNYSSAQGNPAAYNALASLYFNGHYDLVTKEQTLVQNVSYAVELL